MYKEHVSHLWYLIADIERSENDNVKAPKCRQVKNKKRKSLASKRPQESDRKKTKTNNVQTDKFHKSDHGTDEQKLHKKSKKHKVILIQLNIYMQFV